MSTRDHALALQRQGKAAEAFPLLLAAIRDDPLNADLWRAAAQSALDLRRYSHAAHLFESCLRFDPKNAEAVQGLWYTRMCVGDFEGAATWARRAVELDRTDVDALYTLGQLAYVLGRPEEGCALHEQALAAEAEGSHRARRARFLRLLRGDYARGWGYFRPDSKSMQLERGPWRPPADLAWHGEVDRSRTVCVYKDGGNGDVFLFARYIPLIAERVGRVVLTAPASHDRLLASVPGLAAVVRHPEEAGEAAYAHMWSLPGIFGTAIDTIPGPVPYLRAPATGPELPPAGGLRVGLAWAGHPNTAINHDRSVPSPELLEPLFAVPGVDWVALQVGYRSEDADRLPFRMRPTLGDFGDTAFVLRQLDLLVTVDTAIANLAGALGTPAWVMPPTYPEFRWGLAGDSTPWYPSVRLFRRAHTREWTGVIGRVAAALAERAADR